MTAVNQNDDEMSLSPDRLNDLDRWILDFLQEHEWATPNLLRARYSDELAADDSTVKDSISRQYVSKRLTRLVEHDHVEKVHEDSYEYRIVDDPRENGGD